MPIFEYRCTACGERYEVLVPRAGRGTPPCPRCGAARTERLPSTFAVGRGSAAGNAGPCGADDCACRRE